METKIKDNGNSIKKNISALGDLFLAILTSPRPSPHMLAGLIFYWVPKGWSNSDDGGLMPL